MREGRFATPIPQQLSDDLGKPRKRIENILTLLESWGRVVKLDDNVYLHMDAVREARLIAISEMEQEAEQLGANAVIGVDLDYETVGGNASMLMVSASGTAVILD